MTSLLTLLKRNTLGLAAALCFTAVGAASAGAPYFPTAPSQPTQPAPQTQPAQPSAPQAQPAPQLQAASPLIGTWGRYQVVDGRQVLLVVQFRNDGTYELLMGDPRTDTLLMKKDGVYSYSDGFLVLDGGGPGQIIRVQLSGPGTLIDGDGGQWTRVA